MRATKRRSNRRLRPPPPSSHISAAPIRDVFSPTTRRTAAPPTFWQQDPSAIRPELRFTETPGGVRSRSRQYPAPPPLHPPRESRVKADGWSAAGRRKGNAERRESGGGCSESSEGSVFMVGSVSALWRRLGVCQRVVGLGVGFACIYWVMFARYYAVEGEKERIHEEVDKLIKYVNSSVFERGKEADVPEIFREGGEREKEKEEAQAGFDVEQLMPRKDEAIANVEKGGREVEAEKASREGREDAVENEQLRQNERVVVSREGESNSDWSAPKKKKRKKRKNKKQAVRIEPVDKPVPEPHETIPKQEKKKKKKKRRTTAETSEESSATSTTKNEVYNQLSADSVENDEASHKFGKKKSGMKKSEKKKSGKRRSKKNKRRSLQRSTVGNLSSFPHLEANYSYLEDFRDLTINDVPDEHVPVLNWKYEEVLNPDTAEQVFGLGKKMDHLAAYKPLCLQAETGKAISFGGRHQCSGFNRTAGWMMQYCSVMREDLPRETLLDVNLKPVPKAWLNENREAIRWVEGLTVLQILEKNCGNIAHFAGRALMLQHIIENIAAYAAPPSTIENIVVLPTFHIMKRFIYPHNYEFWHKSMFSALIAPAEYTIGTLGNFLYREQKAVGGNKPRVQLLHNFSMVGGNEQNKHYVCFRRAIVPGFLKGRFFIDDMEYPSRQPSLQSSAANAPRIPRDSLRLRERISAFLHENADVTVPKKRILFLDRGGQRRVFEAKVKLQVTGMLQHEAQAFGYTFEMVSFDRMPFRQQFEAMESASIAIGIHGANIVNTMFMPPLSVLIELFPFGFEHDMYENGGNAGLKYFKYQMKSGIPFHSRQPFLSVEQCIRLDHNCKVHYRDSALQVTQDDMVAMRELLHRAIAWCDQRAGNEEETRNAGSTAAQDGEAGGRKLLYKAVHWVGQRRGTVM